MACYVFNQLVWPFGRSRILRTRAEEYNCLRRDDNERAEAARSAALQGAIAVCEMESPKMNTFAHIR